MFTGIVEEMGTIKEVNQVGQNSVQLTINARKVNNEMKIGDSISVNGICLTVTSFQEDFFMVDVMPETIKSTSLNEVREGINVNLERSMSADGRFGGHFVSGHIDGIGKIINKSASENAIDYTIEIPTECKKYLIPKGSIAIDGISLTIVDHTEKTVTVSLIPHTAAVTILGQKEIDDIVNIEYDMLIKAVIGAWHPNNSKLSELSGCQAPEIDEVIADLKVGKPVIVVDHEDRENEGDLVALAENITPDVLNFMITHGKGLVCTAITKEDAERLSLEKMVNNNTDPLGTAFTVSVDHIDTTTGISTFERAKTIRALANPHTKATDFRKPGHVFPLIAKDGGVLNRPGHTEAAVDLAKLSGAYPSGVICEIVKEDGTMARIPDLKQMAEKFSLKLISIETIKAYMKQKEPLVKREVETALPSAFGNFMIFGYTNILDDKEHIAFVKGYPFAKEESILVRVHSECLTGDIFGSHRCDCGPQLHESLRKIEAAGKGIVIYMRQEGRGIGLINKLKAYHLQDQGYDTVEANEHLGFAPDLRKYDISAQILLDLGAKNIHLLTNNPDKMAELENNGINIVSRVPLKTKIRQENERYMKTKIEKLGHLL